MKKSSLFIGLVMLSTALTFGLDRDDMMIRSGIHPAAFLATGIGGLAMVLGILLSYLAISYGTYLLSKKYAPKLHPAWSWIPIAQIYPIVVISGQSPWWILAILLGSIVPVIGPIIVLCSVIYIYYWLAKRLNRDIGTVILLLFFSVIMIPYLGLKAHNKPTTLAWVLGVAAMILLFIGGGLAAAGAGRAMMGLEGQYDFMGKAQNKMMEEINDNPNIQEQMKEIQQQMMGTSGANTKTDATIATQ